MQWFRFNREQVDEDDKESYVDPDVASHGHFASSVRTRPRAKSVASTKLKEQGLDEILPIQDTNSSKVKVEGSFTVEESGNYVLVFGWAKRWFHLSPSGVLSYSTSPTSVTRGSIQVVVSTISNTPKQRLIHIDTGTMLYHLKTLTPEDHDTWTKALRSCKATTFEAVEEQVSAEEEDGKLRVQIEQGIRSTDALIAEFSKAFHSMEQLHQLISQGNMDAKQLLELSSQLLIYKESLSGRVHDQQAQWSTALETLAPCLNCQRQRLSENMAEVVDIQHGTAHRASSLNSGASVFSEQFFDAEDIVLSAEDDYTEEDITVGDSTDEEGDESEETCNLLNLSNITDCKRRNQLPSPAVGDVGSALSVFRKNVGKDLSTIAMPVSMNEPLSMLQRACEELEYSELLDKASILSDSMERLMYVAVFAISGYASSQYRSGRKPFNPMMTETYENIRPDKGFRFIAEKVSHNPLIIAEFMTEGTFHITLSGHDDHFTYCKPSSWLRNMIAGEKYLEHAGEMKVINQTTGEYAIITFKEGTGGRLFSAPTNRNDVTATLFDTQDQKRRRVVGKWSEGIAEEVDMNKRQLSVLWNASPPGIDDHTKYYGFTRFAVELNEITSIESDRLPKTDTRYRPDQRLYEQGQVDEADTEKQRIEQKQRERRKEMQLNGIDWKPRWFELRNDTYVDPTVNETNKSWQFTGQYWQNRESGHWPTDLFDLW
ncbi:hypothetical protein DFQ28_011405 [Apophysomyces sp. BC1034]|nr:hypothetical protein DFQ30_011250 [Apophysomyces sp. BC1015]KAG0169173.1 hypothetical protein DFQ29_009872 [Apophysomyces sp. BC1021]KAG0184322.1 hypothetical protein DFQ28_011405 [Apophysomyces sp. BC1034]